MHTLPAQAAALTKVERKQETVELGNNRYIVFIGESNGTQFGYTADLIVTDKGVPHFEPIFTEEFDVDSRNINLSEGIAFQAESYHFDKITNMLDYTFTDSERHQRFQFKYHLDTDLFTLREVVMQKEETCEKPPCAQTTTPQVIYKAKYHAPAK